jgi:Na+/proline symporter
VKNLSGAQRNMLSFSGVLVVVNLLFLILGAALFLYAKKVAMVMPGSSDDLFPSIALHYLPPAIGLIFLIGLISALFPSADGAITALTSSFCIDILGLQRREDLTEQEKRSKRLKVHLSFAVIFYVCVLVFKVINEKAIIDLLLDIAGYTYGPLLGLFSFGILTSRKVVDRLVPYVAVFSPLLCYGLNYVNNVMHLLGSYQIGLELLIINGALTFAGLWLFASRHSLEHPVDIAH